jgi:hypothetical protein
MSPGAGGLEAAAGLGSAEFHEVRFVAGFRFIDDVHQGGLIPLDDAANADGTVAAAYPVLDAEVPETADMKVRREALPLVGDGQNASASMSASISS